MTLTDALEQHWAVRAIEPARHRLALSTARRLLDAAGANDAHIMTPPERAALSDVATAYDVAVQELVLRETASAQLLALAQQLRASAATALMLRLALRHADDIDSQSAVEALHRSALAVVADKFEHVVRETLPLILGEPAQRALEKVVPGTLVAPGQLVASSAAPLRLPVGDGRAVVVTPGSRMGQDGPLVVTYRAVLDAASPSPTS